MNRAKFEMVAPLNLRERCGHAFACLIVAVGKHAIDGDVVNLLLIFTES